MAVFAALSGLVYATIVLVDPYDIVPFSLPLDREPVSTNQRFAYPALARSSAFDSAVIGSSTLRLLDPRRLDALTGARFVNLAMNSATAYEQWRIFELFMRHHPRTRYLVVGIDDAWCSRGDTIEKYTFREFPEWMFDDNRFNDLLYMFNDKALENTVRLLEYLAGKREAKYRRDGFRDFTRDFGPYDPDIVRTRLYPSGAAAAPPARDDAATDAHPEWMFAQHTLLAKMLDEVPADTDATLILAPFHAAYLQRGAALYQECKRRVTTLATARGVRVMDYMRVSALTKDDANYWDPLHYTQAVAQKIMNDYATALSPRPLRSARESAP